MRDDELSPEEEAEVEQLAADVVREAARVGIDWELATERLRTLASQEWAQAEDDASAEVTLGLDLTALLETLRGLPDGAGTERFLTAFERLDTGYDPT